jgi:hypothetical protein
MTDVDLRDQILHLEARIDALAETIEGCRKIILVSKFAIAAGAIAMPAMLLGAIQSDPVVLSGATAALLGGIALFGSNTSTAKQASAKMKDAEALRAELIGRLDLRPVADGLKTQRS